jgi:hypothetical protein
MKAETELWQLMTHDGVYQADLPTLKQWVAEGLVRPTDRVRKGALKWIEAERAPALRRVFTGEEVPEFVQESAAAAPNTHATQGAQGAHAALAESHAQAVAIPAQDAPSSPQAAANVRPVTHEVGVWPKAVAGAEAGAQDLGLGAGGAPFAGSARGGFIEAVSTKDFPGVPAADPVLSGEPSLASACRNHPAEAATLICRECRLTFCRACPNRMGTSSVMLCPECGNFCDPLESVTERLSLYERAGSGFGFDDFTEALAYPLKHLASLIGGALLYGFLLIIGVRGQLLASALVFGCISLVIHRVGYGRMDRDFLPDFSEFSFWDDVLIPFFLGLGITLVTLGPVIVLFLALVFGWFGVGATQPTAEEAARQQQQSQAITAEDMKVLSQGGTAEEEAAVRRKIDGATPAGQLAREVKESKRTNDDSPLYIVRALLSRPGLFFVLALLAIAWAAFYHPMALLVAGWTESFKSTINPLVGIDTMRHMGANYFKAFLMYLTVTAASFTLDAVVAFVTSPFDMPFVGNIPARFIGGVVTFYTSLVIACVLGLALFKSADRLGIELD